MTQQDIDFFLRFSVDRDDLVGARWWNQAAIAERRFPRRDLLVFGAVAGVVVVGTGALVAGFLSDLDLGDGDSPGTESVAEALDLQRREGWDVGRGAANLLLTGGTPFDADNGQVWKAHVATLATALEPPLRLRPYYVPTLFQAPAQPSLRAQMQPVHSKAADVTYQRALALGNLLAEGDANGLGLILDLPGEDAVAAAAALSDRFWPVFAFGNWPHPRGVVPSHQTLGAALYYLPRLRASASRLSPDRPPVFVLDSNRLNPYGDDPERFDNRYLAQLPSAEKLRSLGIERLMYVRPQGASSAELDDLNDEFVAFDEAGLPVRFVSLGDFTQDSSTGAQHYFWGGSPAMHVLFWPSYWRRIPPPLGPSTPAPIARDRSSPGAALGRPTRFEPRPSIEYRPTRRDTMFSSRTIGGGTGVGKQKPSGFGMVSVRRDDVTGARTVGRSDGKGSPTDTGRYGRSGSFGRSSGSYGG